MHCALAEQGTRNADAAGFKLDTLLKLADVKGTDRKTSLLHFVLAQVGGRWAGARGGIPRILHGVGI